ncbi:MAG: polysaccharide deacetylase family protein [Verrucomicrobiota bacterium JB024]|nr:polysaccharide deacetylase family protein [Verrucomicrobiota bacterium JB024]
MSVVLDRWPEGKSLAVAWSFDDGFAGDAAVIERLNTRGARGTFHLSNAFLGSPGYVSAAQIREVYAGHEVAAHGLSHSYLTLVPPVLRRDEIRRNRLALEELSGQAVVGLAYPGGYYNRDVEQAAREAGCAYARSTVSTQDIAFPAAEEFTLHPTCHERNLSDALINRFLHPANESRGRFLLVWGHAVELDKEKRWDGLERQLDLLCARQKDIWWCTLSEVARYLAALRRLHVDQDGGIIRNASASEIFLSRNGQLCRLLPDESLSWK